MVFPLNGEKILLVMRIDVISAVPNILSAPLNESIIKRARSKKIIDIHVHDLRDYAEGKYRQVDDRPFGGGAGMVLMPEPMFKCLEMLLGERKYDEIICLSPQGKKLNQKKVNALSLKKNLILICGHYKGIDQRIIDTFVTMELSIGDYVLSGGEIPALVVIDSIVRLLPGAISDGESALTDSFQTEAGFDAPQYTRPAEFKGMKVPGVLLKGNHKEIEKWRIEQGMKKYSKVKRKKLNNI
jgi:tRNA (guanine37-N1)-methyltransferase